MVLDDLLDGIVALLKLHPAISKAKVARGPVDPLQIDQFPYFAVFLGPDVPLSDLGANNINNIDWDVVVFVECYARGTQDSIDRLSTDQRADVHEVLMADPQQATMPFVMNTVPAGAEEPVLTSKGRKKNSAYRVNWVFRIRTHINQIRQYP